MSLPALPRGAKDWQVENTVNRLLRWLNSLTTRGDLLVRDSTGDLTRLAIGTDGQVLTSDGTDAKWADVPHNLLQMVSFETGSAATGATLIPFDDTKPQSSEGNQYMTLAITPKSATSKLVIEVIFVGDSSVVTNIIVALFQDSGTDALACVFAGIQAANGVMTIPLRHVMTAGTTSATTFKVRAGLQATGTLTMNGVSGSRAFGGVLTSSIVIREYAT